MSIIVPALGPENSDILAVGEAPGCVSGDTLIDTAFRDKSKYPLGIPIRDLIGSINQYAYCFDLESQSLAIAAIRSVWKSGVKKVYRVTYEWWSHAGSGKKIIQDSILVTSNHPFLIKRKAARFDPFASRNELPPAINGYLSLEQGLTVGHGLQPFLSNPDGQGYRRIGTNYKSVARESRYCLSFKLERPLLPREQCHHIDENKENDTWDNLELLTIEDHARHHAIKFNPMLREGVKEKHKTAMSSESYRQTQSQNLKQFLSDPAEYEKRLQQIQRDKHKIARSVQARYQEPEYYWKYLQGRLKTFPSLDDAWSVRKFRERFPDIEIPTENHKIISIEYVGVQDVYDMEVDHYHNFACHGVFVHNSREAQQGKPFVGDSGRELERLLSRHGLSSSSWRKTNIVPEYFEGNPDPTFALIEKWRSYLLEEIDRYKPKLIIPVGRFAAKWFLGGNAELETVRGLPRRAVFDPFDDDMPSCLDSAIIIPVTHSAAGLYEDEAGVNLKRAQLSWDFTSLSYYIKLLKQKKFATLESLIISNSHPDPDYRDVTGEELKSIILEFQRRNDLSEIAIDTEGDPNSPESIQVSLTPGTGYTLWCWREDFHVGISVLQKLADSGVTFIMHCASTPGGCMYDILMPRVMGLNLSRAKIIDTMYMLYLMRLEARGLKPASLRWCDLTLSPYMDLIGDIGKNKQLDYLQKVVDLKLPKPEPMIIDENDGTQRIYSPNSLSSLAGGILKDVLSGKETKKGPTNPFSRWKDIDKSLRRPAESLLGKIPVGTLRDLPQKDAAQYACADPDATFRLKNRLIPELERLDLIHTANLGFENLPTFEIMQHHGMPASRSRFSNLHSLMTRKCEELRHKLSIDYYNGKPINPGSTKQTASLLRRQGLTGNKKTPTGTISTGKKSIEHLRYKNEAIKLVFDWREHFHIATSFCDPYLEAIPEDTELYNVTSILDPANTHTRRLAGKDPNPLNTPTRTDIGRMVRDCFIAPEGFLFLGADLSQIELRVLASLSDSKFLINAFLNNEDIHTRTAMEVNGISKEEVLSNKEKYRTPAKTTNFGIVYGQGDNGLYDELNRLGIEGWDLISCKKLRKEILNLFGINKWTTQVSADALKFDYARDLGGMYRYLPNLRSSDNRLLAEAQRHAVSQIVQGTAQTMIQNSMAHLKSQIWDIEDNGFLIWWLLQYHDELIFLIEESIADVVMEIVIESMTKHSGIKLKVPVLAEGHTAKEWGKLK